MLLRWRSTELDGVLRSRYSAMNKDVMATLARVEDTANRHVQVIADHDQLVGLLS